MKTAFEKSLLVSHIFLLVLLSAFRFLGGFDENELLLMALLLVLHLPVLFFLKKQPISHFWAYMLFLFLIISLKTLLGLIGFGLMMALLGGGMLVLGIYLISRNAFSLGNGISEQKRLSKEQVEAIITEIDNYDLAKAFEMLDRFELKMPEYNRLKQIFILGKDDVDYIAKLKIFVRSL